MTMSPTLSQPALVGSQQPRLVTRPDWVSSAGPEAVALARTAGLFLDPWQEAALEVCCAEKVVTLMVAGEATQALRWAAREFGLLVARQNGKGGVLEALVLAHLFLFGSRKIVWTAHELKTAREAYDRLRALIESTPALLKRVKRRGTRIVGFKNSHEDTSIELEPEPGQSKGQIVQFMARTKGSGRGFTGDLVIYDEAQELPSKGIDASMPTISARPNPQIVYTGTVPTPENNAEHFTKVRDRGRAGGDRFLAWVEYTPDPGRTDDGEPGDYESLVALLAATEMATAERLTADQLATLDAALVASNPALGYRISADGSEMERVSMTAAGYARERLSIWPSGKARSWQLFTSAKWGAACAPVVPGVEWIADPLTLAVEVTPDRSWTTIAAAGRTVDGRVGVEVVDHRPGTDWVVDRLAHLAAKLKPKGLLLDPRGGAGPFTRLLDERGVTYTTTNGTHFAAACMGLYDAVMVGEEEDPTTVHHDQLELSDAAEHAARRQLQGGDTWVFDRRRTVSTPLGAVALARWGALEIPDPVPVPGFIVVG